MKLHTQDYSVPKSAVLQHVMASIRIHFVTKQHVKYRGLGMTGNKSFNWRLNSYM